MSDIQNIIPDPEKSYKTLIDIEPDDDELHRNIYSLGDPELPIFQKISHEYMFPDKIQISKKTAAITHEVALESRGVSYEYMAIGDDPETDKSYRKERKIRVWDPGHTDICDSALAARVRTIPVKYNVDSAMGSRFRTIPVKYDFGEERNIVVGTPYLDENEQVMGTRFRNMPAIPLDISFKNLEIESSTPEMEHIN